jgi:hypothetical protein
VRLGEWVAVGTGKTHDSYVLTSYYDRLRNNPCGVCEVARHSVACDPTELEVFMNVLMVCLALILRAGWPRVTI